MDLRGRRLPGSRTQSHGVESVEWCLAGPLFAALDGIPLWLIARSLGPFRAAAKSGAPTLGSATLATGGLSSPPSRFPLVGTSQIGPEWSSGIQAHQSEGIESVAPVTLGGQRSGRCPGETVCERTLEALDSAAHRTGPAGPGVCCHAHQMESAIRNRFDRFGVRVVIATGAAHRHHTRWRRV